LTHNPNASDAKPADVAQRDCAIILRVDVRVGKLKLLLQSRRPLRTIHAAAA
jgi:hypothetical protein